MRLLKTVFVLFLALASVAPSPGHAETTVASYSGTGGRITETFTIDDNWSARWTSERGRFALVLRRTDGGTTRTAATAYGRAEGEAGYGEGGTYTLEVTAEGPWRVDIVER